MTNILVTIGSLGREWSDILLFVKSDSWWLGCQLYYSQLNRHMTQTHLTQTTYKCLVNVVYVKRHLGIKFKLFDIVNQHYLLPQIVHVNTL